MTKTSKILLITLALTGGLATSAFADQPGADWLPKEQLIQKLEAAGYADLREIEADDGHWEGEGTKNGVRMEFHADPRTGAILGEKQDKDDD